MEWGNHVILRVTMTSLLLVSLEGYHYGADPHACGDLTPLHDSRPRADMSPYSIHLSNTTYSPGVPISVTLSANTGNSFKGFLIQARISELGPDFDKAVGNFTPVQGTKSVCLWRVGLTHTNADLKTALTFTWNPPNTLQGKIQFRTTFVQSRYSYWVAQLSGVLNEGETTTSSTTTTTTTPVPTTQTAVTETVTSSTGANTVSPSDGGDITTKTTMDSSMTTPIVGDGGGTGTVTSSLMCFLVGLGMCLVTRRLETT